MVPTTKLLRFIKSPFIISTCLFLFIYSTLLRHHSDNHVTMKRSYSRNTTIFISSSLQREIEGLCPLLEPSENDLIILQGRMHRKTSHLSTQDNKLICDVIKMCDRFSYTVQCRTTECGQYRVDFTLNKSSKSNITMDLLEKIIFDQIFGDRDHDGDIGSKIQVFCEKTYLSKVLQPVRLSLDIEYSENKFCYDNDQILQNIHNSQELFPLDARVFHFTHISRNEFISKFNNFASVHLSLVNEKVEVIDFKRVQAEHWDEQKMLGRVLPDIIYTDQHSKLNNICFNIVDLACNISYPRHKFFHKFLINSNGPCRKFIGVLAENRELVQSFCNRISNSQKGPNTKGGVSYYYDFYSLFTMAHITNTFEQTLLSTSMVNLSEVRSHQIEHMDKALTNIVSELLAKQNSIVILASDAGRPSTLSLKSKEFFHVENSNPMFFILLPKRLRLSLGEDLTSILKMNSFRLISTADIQETIIDLMEKSARIQKSGSEYIGKDASSGHSMLDPLTKSRSCSQLNIAPPLLCICEGVFASYPNDSIQTAFVEFAIGTINKELSENNATCSFISGVMFSNIRIAHNRGSRLMKFDLDVNLDRYGTIYQINDLEIAFNGFSSLRNFDIKMKELDFKDKKILSEFSQFGCTSLSGVDVSYPLNLDYANLKGFGVDPEIVPLHQQCLMLVVRNYGDSVTYIIGNFCESRQYRVMFNLELFQMISTVPLPVSLILDSGDVKFLCSITKQSYNIRKFSHTYQYDIHYDIYP
ncbi:hypothetical protein LOTGIDRAFT_155503 [Lottia gigantea]|uniref:Uncharacterized protein n=1 Tax=Lottia gigantea TaxID=225164 RepID=V3Z0X8_LOTGI|nr:hypothetical protein LOTGIDRAFT_155503 [Lottia gigantea]ESO84178.1 hypothetical protein LOTGIDRAFT_155503 [Lottia gigantea]